MLIINLNLLKQILNMFSSNLLSSLFLIPQKPYMLSHIVLIIYLLQVDSMENPHSQALSTLCLASPLDGLLKSVCLYSFARASITQCKLGSLNTRNLFSHSSRGQKSKIVLIKLVSSLSLACRRVLLHVSSHGHCHVCPSYKDAIQFILGYGHLLTSG